MNGILRSFLAIFFQPHEKNLGLEVLNKTQACCKVWKSGGRAVGDGSNGNNICRDVTTGATGATEVAPKFSDTLTLSTIAEVAPNFFLRLRPCYTRLPMI